MAFVDGTVVNVALPALQSALGATISDARPRAAPRNRRRARPAVAAAPVVHRVAASAIDRGGARPESFKVASVVSFGVLVGCGGTRALALHGFPNRRALEKFLVDMLLLLALLAAAPAGLSLHDRGKDLAPLSHDAVLAAAPAQAVSVHEPHAELDRSYRAIPVRPLLDRAFGAAWRKSDVVVFGCADGYQSVVPTRSSSRTTRSSPSARPTRGLSRIDNHAQHEQVELGPWYLVWKDDPEVRADGGADWPYQVVSIELDSLARRFPKLGPPENASASARRGFAIFRRQCIACHTINGEGGNKAPELNYPVNVTEYFAGSWLTKWIANPRSLRFSTNMPALDPSVPNRDQQIADVIAYLRAMRGRKLAPAVPK